MKLHSLSIEYQNHLIGIDSSLPRFSWVLQSDKQDVVQVEYQIVLREGGNTLWDSGKVPDDVSVLVEYSGPALQPTTRYEWSLFVWDNHGEMATADSWFETGLLDYTQMQAEWITHPYEDDVEAWDTLRMPLCTRRCSWILLTHSGGNTSQKPAAL